MPRRRRPSSGREAAVPRPLPPLVPPAPPAMVSPVETVGLPEVPAAQGLSFLTFSLERGVQVLPRPELLAQDGVLEDDLFSRGWVLLTWTASFAPGGVRTSLAVPAPSLPPQARRAVPERDGTRLDLGVCLAVSRQARFQRALGWRISNSNQRPRLDQQTGSGRALLTVWDLEGNRLHAVPITTETDSLNGLSLHVPVDWRISWPGGALVVLDVLSPSAAADDRDPQAERLRLALVTRTSGERESLHALMSELLEARNAPYREPAQVFLCDEALPAGDQARLRRLGTLAPDYEWWLSEIQPTVVEVTDGETTVSNRVLKVGAAFDAMSSAFPPRPEPSLSPCGSEAVDYLFHPIVAPCRVMRHLDRAEMEAEHGRDLATAVGARHALEVLLAGDSHGQPLQLTTEDRVRAAHAFVVLGVALQRLTLARDERAPVLRSILLWLLLRYTCADPTTAWRQELGYIQITTRMDKSRTKSLLAACPWLFAFIETSRQAEIVIGLESLAIALLVLHPGVTQALRALHGADGDALSRLRILRLVNPSTVREGAPVARPWSEAQTLFVTAQNVVERRAGFIASVQTQLRNARDSGDKDRGRAYEALRRASRAGQVRAVQLFANPVQDGWQLFIGNPVSEAGGSVQVGGKTLTLGPGRTTLTDQPEDVMFGELAESNRLLFVSRDDAFGDSSVHVQAGVGGGAQHRLVVLPRGERTQPPTVTADGKTLTEGLFVGRDQLLEDARYWLVEQGSPQPVILHGNRRAGKTLFAAHLLSGLASSGRLAWRTPPPKIDFTGATTVFLGYAQGGSASAADVQRFAADRVLQRLQSAWRKESRLDPQVRPLPGVPGDFASLLELLDALDEYGEECGAPLGLFLDEFDWYILSLIKTGGLLPLVELGNRQWGHLALVATTQRWQYWSLFKNWHAVRIPGIVHPDALLDYFAPYMRQEVVDLHGGEPHRLAPPDMKVRLEAEGLRQVHRRLGSRPFLWAMLYRVLLKATASGAHEEAFVPTAEDLATALDEVEADNPLTSMLRDPERLSAAELPDVTDTQRLLQTLEGLTRERMVQMTADLLTDEERAVLVLFRRDQTAPSADCNAVSAEGVRRLLDREVLVTVSDGAAYSTAGEVWQKPLREDSSWRLYRAAFEQVTGRPAPPA